VALRPRRRPPSGANENRKCPAVSLIYSTLQGDFMYSCLTLHPRSTPYSWRVQWCAISNYSVSATPLGHSHITHEVSAPNTLGVQFCVHRSGVCSIRVEPPKDVCIILATRVNSSTSRNFFFRWLFSIEGGCAPLATKLFCLPRPFDGSAGMTSSCQQLVDTNVPGHRRRRVPGNISSSCL
jgi:hypothetical protein